jgi:Spy/CpxP family protein refolding chaperone
MKKYVIVVFSGLLIVSLILSFSLQADKGHYNRDMRVGGMSIGKGHHNGGLFQDLDEDILKKMQEMRLRNKEEMLDLKNQIGKKKLEMEKVLLEDKLDFKKILSIHNDISELKQKISRNRIEHKIEMYKILPDEKKEIAKRMFLHLFSREKHGRPGMNNWEREAGCKRNK